MSPYYRRSRRRYHRSHDGPNPYAEAHIADYNRLVAELGGSVEDVKQYLFDLPQGQLAVILQDYEKRYGPTKRNYAATTLEAWRTGKRRMSATTLPRTVTSRVKIGVIVRFSGCRRM